MAAGRPRKFDYDTALEQAMRVFWQKGFAGTSMPDLTKAMGMNRPSIYAAYGNKEALFTKALERYETSTLERLNGLLDVVDLRQAIRQFLLEVARYYNEGDTPNGCLLVQGALVGSDESAAACDEARKRREIFFTVLRDRFKKAQEEGALPRDTQICHLARFYTAVLQGMAVQSVSGASCDTMRAVAELAVQILPDSTKG